MNFKLVETILIILLMILTGFISKKVNILSEEDVPTLNKIVVNIGMPCMIFVALLDLNLATLPTLSILPFLCMGFSLITAFFVFIWCKIRKYSKKVTWSLLLASLMINTGFIGYPLILSVFGVQGLIRGVFFDLGSILMFISIGLVLLFVFGGSYKVVFKKALSFPAFWALVLSLIFVYFKLSVPDLILNILNYFSGLTVPLIMISLGLTLDFGAIKNYFLDASVVTFFRLILVPFLGLFLISWIGLEGLDRIVLIVDSALPSGMLMLSYAITYDLDFKRTAAAIFLSTILCLVTLPMWILIV
jgi:hypothetical protein